MTQFRKVKNISTSNVLTLLATLVVLFDLPGMINACAHELEALHAFGGHHHCDHADTNVFDFPTINQSEHHKHSECCESSHEQTKECSHIVLNNVTFSPTGPGRIIRQLIYSMEPESLTCCRKIFAPATDLPASESVHHLHTIRLLL